MPIEELTILNEAQFLKYEFFAKIYFYFQAFTSFNYFMISIST